MSFNNISVFKANTKSKLFFCDSNFCLELVNYYYRGKFKSNDDEVLQKFLLELKNPYNGFIFDFALNELSFDYSSNSINAAMYKHLNSAINNLLSMTSEEIQNHSGINYKRIADRDQTCNIKSIFESSFPYEIVKKIEDFGLEQVFYATYLFRLKIQELYLNNSIDPLKKIESFFDFCVDRIDMIPGIELQLAQMLFVGESTAMRTAKKLLKVDMPQSVKLLNNTVEDIFLFRICQKYSMEFQKIKPLNVNFLTSDRALSDLLTVSELVASSNYAADIETIDLKVRPQLYGQWSQLYNTKMLPIMRKRYLTSFQNKNIDFNVIKQEIQHLEKVVLSS